MKLEETTDKKQIEKVIEVDNDDKGEIETKLDETKTVSSKSSTKTKRPRQLSCSSSEIKYHTNLELENHNLRNELKDSRNVNSRLNNNLNSSEEEVGRLSKRLRRCRDDLYSCEDELKDYKKKLYDCEDELQRLREENNKLRNRLIHEITSSQSPPMFSPISSSSSSSSSFSFDDNLQRQENNFYNDEEKVLILGSYNFNTFIATSKQKIIIDNKHNNIGIIFKHNNNGDIIFFLTKNKSSRCNYIPGKEFILNNNNSYDNKQLYVPLKHDSIPRFVITIRRDSSYSYINYINLN